MDIESFRKGAIIGFAIAAPVGPIGVLVIQRSLGSGLAGLSTGLGAATADALYALAGALAMALVQRLLGASWMLELVGAAVLGWLAARTWSQRPKSAQGLPTAPGQNSATTLGLVRAFGETLFLTLANPATILSFAAVSATGGFGPRAEAPVFALSVFAGSAAWWLLLSTGVRFGARRLSSRAFQNLHVASGIVLATYAVLTFVKALSDF